jgi:trk system potassium uptake protein
VYILIVGCGHLGSSLSQDLSNQGHDICVIDRSADKLGNLGTGFNGQRIRGIEFDNDNLVAGGIKLADVLLAVTADDNINITVALVASRIFHVPKIIARANDPSRKYIYDTLGIDIINPTQLCAEILKKSLI